MKTEETDDMSGNQRVENNQIQGQLQGQGPLSKMTEEDFTAGNKS